MTEYFILQVKCDFESLQNRLYVVIGKTQSDRRRLFDNKMKSEKTKVHNDYNRLLKVLKIKQKQFQQEQYSQFSFEKNRKVKRGESFDVIKFKEVI